MVSKSQLAIKLSKLKTFESPKLMSEQYSTDSEIAADVLWLAYMNKDITNKTIVDLGCGTGILGIGCLLLGAKKVYFIDNDEAALETAESNLEGLKNYELIKSDVHNVNVKADVVIQNPPFGTKQKHADKNFLLKAFKIANVIYTLHKSTSIDFVNKLSKANHFNVTHMLRYSLPIKHQHNFHRRRIHRIDVSCFRLEKS